MAEKSAWQNLIDYLYAKSDRGSNEDIDMFNATAGVINRAMMEFEDYHHNKKR